MKYLIILLVLFYTPLFSQINELSGRILNSANSLPLEFVNVIIVNKDIGTATDNNGYFLLKGNIEASDLLRISHVAFDIKEIKVQDFLSLANKEIFLDNKIITSQTVLVSASIGKEGVTPISFSKIKRDEIRSTYTVQDFPELISTLPSVMFYSENGNGLGYNYLSIRGFDQRRISVSINGIPQNDPEDHNVYWLDFPDLIESTELIQVQRGAGSGVAGYPAIGGAINIITSTFSDKPHIELSSSIGSYNTRKYSASVSSGLINNKYSIYAKLSHTLSSGYRNSSWIDFKSYHLSAVRYDENLTTQINLFGGPIADGLAYTGLPKFTIKDRELRKANYSYWEADVNNYTYKQNRRPDEIENFSQPHYELLNEYKLNNNITINSALFLVLGNGFFDYDGSWADTSYLRLTRDNGFMANDNPRNVLIRAMVENKHWGWIPRVSIKHFNGELIFGGELRFHNSIHWGSIGYGENLPAGITKDYRYYYYEGGKNIINLFIHENYNLTKRTNILAEVQLAYHEYKIANERYLHNNFSVDGLFLNPRIGINYKLLPQLNLYASFARVTREPRLKNYYDAAESSGGAVPQFEQNAYGTYDFTKPIVKPETMNSIEIGTALTNENISASINTFYMLFNNEIVRRGTVDRFGQPVTGNMDRTIHYGIEAVVNPKINQKFDIVLNGTLSKNYISKGFTYFKSNAPINSLDLSGNRISGFPDVMINLILRYKNKGFYAQINGKYVGDFYTDNYDRKLNEYKLIYPNITSYNDNRVDAYFTTNFFCKLRYRNRYLFKDYKSIFSGK